MSARVGIIVPSSNTVAEVDFYRRLPADATLHTARMRLEEATPEGEATMLDEHLPAAVADVATARPDVVVFACTSAGALRGNAYEAQLVQRIAADTGAHTISVAASVRRALGARGVRRVGVVTPYVESLNRKIRESLEAEGLEVAWIRGLGITENFAIAAVEPKRIAEFALECGADGDVDAVFASCTNFRALDARERLEEALGVPVVTSNSAALEAVIEHLSRDAVGTV
jgi:maleate isomerase